MTESHQMQHAGPGVYRLTARFKEPVQAIKAARWLMDGFGVDKVEVYIEQAVSLDAVQVTVCPPSAAAELALKPQAAAPARKWTGTMVKDLRRRLGLSAEQLVPLIGWRSTGSLYNIESGRQSIGQALAAKFEAIAAGVTPLTPVTPVTPGAAPRPATPAPTVPRAATSAPPERKYTPQPPRAEPRPAKPRTVPLPRQPGHGFAASRCVCAHDKVEHQNETGHCLNLVCQRQSASCQRYRPRLAVQPPARPA